MKRLLTLIIAIFFICSGAAFAQIQNGNFELINSDGTLSYWGKTYIFSVVIDTGNVLEGDSIVFDGPFYAPTADAHTGNWALEMRNAMNFTTGQSYEGGAGSYSDSIFAGFSAFNLINLSQQPTGFGFYYKYFPVGNDLGWALLTLFDSTENQLGSAYIMTEATTNNTYQYISTPIQYDMPGDVAFYTLDFSTTAPCGEFNFGTRFLVDDVDFTYSASGIDESEMVSDQVYPNPTNGIIHIKSEQVNQVFIYNSVGKLVKTASAKTIDISDFDNGVYYLKIQEKDKTCQTLRIIKN